MGCSNSNIIINLEDASNITITVPNLTLNINGSGSGALRSSMHFTQHGGLCIAFKSGGSSSLPHSVLPPHNVRYSGQLGQQHSMQSARTGVVPSAPVTYQRPPEQQQQQHQSQETGGSRANGNGRTDNMAMMSNSGNSVLGSPQTTLTSLLQQRADIDKKIVLAMRETNNDPVQPINQPLVRFNQREDDRAHHVAQHCQPNPYVPRPASQAQKRDQRDEADEGPGTKKLKWDSFLDDNGRQTSKVSVPVPEKLSTVLRAIRINNTAVYPIISSASGPSANSGSISVRKDMFDKKVEEGRL